MRYDDVIHIGDAEVSADAPTYFVADIAANHDGDLGRAKDLIYLSKEAGADCAKFQHFLAKDIVSDAGFQSLGGELRQQGDWVVVQGAPADRVGPAGRAEAVGEGDRHVEDVVQVVGDEQWLAADDRDRVETVGEIE